MSNTPWVSGIDVGMALTFVRHLNGDWIWCVTQFDEGVGVVVASGSAKVHAGAFECGLLALQAAVKGAK